MNIFKFAFKLMYGNLNGSIKCIPKNLIVKPLREQLIGYVEEKA